MFNKVILVGNLTRDVELKYFPSGNGCVATLGLAVNRKVKKQDGSQIDDTCFIDAKVYGRTAEVANQYLRKGSKVLIEGRIAQENWEQNGQKRSKHIIQGESIQMLDSKGQDQKHTSQASQSSYTQSYKNSEVVNLAEEYYKNTKTPRAGETEQEDDIPF